MLYSNPARQGTLQGGDRPPSTRHIPSTPSGVEGLPRHLYPEMPIQQRPFSDAHPAISKQQCPPRNALCASKKELAGIYLKKTQQNQLQTEHF